jgi:hypothetical protein
MAYFTRQQCIGYIYRVFNLCNVSPLLMKRADAIAHKMIEKDAVYIREFDVADFADRIAFHIGLSKEKRNTIQEILPVVFNSIPLSETESYYFTCREQFLDTISKGDN